MFRDRSSLPGHIRHTNAPKRTSRPPQQHQLQTPYQFCNESTLSDWQERQSCVCIAPRTGADRLAATLLLITVTLLRGVPSDGQTAMSALGLPCKCRYSDSTVKKNLTLARAHTERMKTWGCSCNPAAAKTEHTAHRECSAKMHVEFTCNQCTAKVREPALAHHFGAQLEEQTGERRRARESGVERPCQRFMHTSLRPRRIARTTDMSVFLD